MLGRFSAACLALALAARGCSDPSSLRPVHLKYRAAGASPSVLAVYEPWFGHPRHIDVGYNSHDPKVVSHQMHAAKAMGIGAFVVDWYGSREPFNDQTYALVQATAPKEHFHVAMMYDETDEDEGATDVALADFRRFRDTYLAPNAPGRDAYLTYNGRPVIFIFPKGKHTDWVRIRQETDTWSPAPLLIQENLPGPDAAAFDGFYAWVSPGAEGWAPDGSHWGEAYLREFYGTMAQKFSDKIIVGGVWSQFDDSKASWGLNRHIDARCGQTFADTLGAWRQYLPADQPPPFLLVETWNDYEEGTAVERGIPHCAGASGK